jgi:hypothetical protein
MTITLNSPVQLPFIEVFNIGDKIKTEALKVAEDGIISGAVIMDIHRC